MARRWRKRITWLIVLVVIVYLGFVLFDKPDYDDPGTEKPVFGDASSPVQIVEFSDLQCPACKSAHPTVQQLKDTYGDKIGFQYYHFPLRPIHSFAQKAAEATECANDQGMFWEFIDAAFANSPDLRKSNLHAIAGQLGLDKELFEACLGSGEKYGEVDADYDYGVSLGVTGTPTFFINGQKVQNWNYASMAAIIDAELGS